MATKLRVSVGDITLDVEGEDSTVLEIYRDFKSSVGDRFRVSPAREGNVDDQIDKGDQEDDAPPAKLTRRKPAKRRPASLNGEKRQETYIPALDKTLKTTGVREF